ncbi:MAG: ABC transporter ATP-binding protein [Bacilli bacterium]
MSVLEVKHLTKDYGSNRGVFDVSFSIKKGEVYGFLGPNGAGKSTTIRHLMGFSKPDSGECKIFGKDCFKNYHNILNNVGYVPGEIALPQGLNGKEFLDMMAKMYKKDESKRIKELLEYFELDDASLMINTKRMSLGIKRKLAVITAFAGDPDVLILDEPTSGLDPLMQERFIALIKEEKKKGKTILLSSHIFSEVDATCDRIGIIKDGHLVNEFIADDLRHSDKKTYRIHFNDNNNYKKFIALKSSFYDLIEKHAYSNVVLVSCFDKDINLLVDLLTKYDVISFSTKKESLQDYFMKFYKEDQKFGGAL